MPAVSLANAKHFIGKNWHVIVFPLATRRTVVSIPGEAETVSMVRDISSGRDIVLNQTIKMQNYPNAEYGHTIDYTVQTGLPVIPRFSSFTRLATGNHFNK